MDEGRPGQTSTRSFDNKQLASVFSFGKEGPGTKRVHRPGVPEFSSKVLYSRVSTSVKKVVVGEKVQRLSRGRYAGKVRKKLGVCRGKHGMVSV